MENIADLMQSSNYSMLPHSQSQCTQALTTSPTDGYEHDSTSKDILIKKATMHLRCRLLEEGLTEAKSKVTHLQSELDGLRIELSTTENVLSKFGEPDDRQLQALERRFNGHQQQLDQLLSSASSMLPTIMSKPSLPANAVTASTSFSSTLSRMSSIFSAPQKYNKKKTGTLTGYQHSETTSNDTVSTSDDDDNDLLTTQEDRDRRSRRRRRVKQLRQEYQQRLRVYDPTWKDDGDWKSTRSPSVDTSNDNNSPTSELDQQPPIQLQKQSTATKPTIASIKKRSSSKQAPTVVKKSPMPSPQSKPAPTQCLCQRKTNKQELIKVPTRTHNSKQSTSIPLETPKHPLSPPADETTRTTSPLLDQHVAPLPPTCSPRIADDDDDVPPTQPNVSEWIMEQRHYLLDQQQEDGDNICMEGKDSINRQHDTPETEDLPSKMKRPLTLTLKKQGHTSKLFDDMLHYLDTFSDFSYDANLQQELSCLLSPLSDQYPRPRSVYPSSSSSSPSSSYSKIASSSRNVYYWNGPRPSSFYHQTRLCKLMANCGMVSGSRYLLNGVNKGLSWFKFLGVLSLALLISLGRGPDHMLLSLDDMDYLDLMADQGEPAYTYYL